MNQFEITAEINRPPEDVFAFLTDIPQAPVWNTDVIQAKLVSEGPLGPGSKVMYQGKFLGRHFESVSECTEFEPAKAYATKSLSGPFQLDISNLLTPTPTGTKLESTFRVESHGFLKLAEPVTISLTKKHFETATDNLKALLEAANSA